MNTIMGGDDLRQDDRRVGVDQVEQEHLLEERHDQQLRRDHDRGDGDGEQGPAAAERAAREAVRRERGDGHRDQGDQSGDEEAVEGPDGDVAAFEDLPVRVRREGALERGQAGRRHVLFALQGGGDRPDERQQPDGRQDGQRESGQDAGQPAVSEQQGRAGRLRGPPAPREEGCCGSGHGQSSWRKRRSCTSETTMTSAKKR
ncbi:hypothetical protein GCM10020295_79870 [Streptomyces cinereospinus]